MLWEPRERGGLSLGTGKGTVCTERGRELQLEVSAETSLYRERRHESVVNSHGGGRQGGTFWDLPGVPNSCTLRGVGSVAGEESAKLG